MRKSKVMFYLITAIMAIVFIAGAVIGIRNYYHSRNNTEGTDASDETYYVYFEDELPDSESVVESYEYVPNEKGTSKEVSAGKDDSKDGADEFLAGTWTTASQGYEYYGISQAMHYVRFSGTDIIYGHYKDREFVPDHTDKATLIEPLPEGGYIIKAETEDGDKYTYRSAESDPDILEHYSTWNEEEFSDHYHGGSSLSRLTDGNIPDHKAGIGVSKSYESDFGRYYELDDGTWLFDGRHYKYRLEITGRMNNAAKDSTFIYLSNIEDIPFDRAVMASGLSSNMADYFSLEEAVFVGWKE